MDSSCSCVALSAVQQRDHSTGSVYSGSLHATMRSCGNKFTNTQSHLSSAHSYQTLVGCIERERESGVTK